MCLGNLAVSGALEATCPDEQDNAENAARLVDQLTRKLFSLRESQKVRVGVTPEGIHTESN